MPEDTEMSQEEMEIGMTVFCLDGKTVNIFVATLVGKQIGETGYELYAVLGANGKKKFLEVAHVYLKKEDAEEHRKRVAPIMAEADKIVEDAKAKVDALRLKVIGKPEHGKLAKLIMTGQLSMGGK